MPKVPDMNILYAPLYEEDYQFVKDNAYGYLKTIEAALETGASPEAIYEFYMRIAPERQRFWLRVKHCACYLQEGGK